MTEPLFAHWGDVASRVRKARAVRLFLDFDGTLAPISAKPGDAELSETTRRSLARLVRHGRLRVTILSGRRRDDVKTRVNLGRMGYWGLFGWEQHSRCSLPLDTRRALRKARARLDVLLGDVPGVELEDKTFGLAIHVRHVRGADRRRARNRMRRAFTRLGSGLHVLQGREVWNVLPSQVQGKGNAVRQALRQSPSPVLPIYVGDDPTDESAFAALARGITVCVGGARDTRARYRVSGPREVARFIERLDEEL